MSVAGRNQGTAAHPLELNIYAGLLELPGVESHPKTPTHGLILGRFLRDPLKHATCTFGVALNGILKSTTTILLAPPWKTLLLRTVLENAIAFLIRAPRSLKNCQSFFLSALTMYARKLRSSDGFIVFVVGIAVFTDMMLYGLIVPMLPYALSDRIGIAQRDVQRWNSILLGSFGGALMLGSLVMGWLGDKVPSRQTPFLLGLIALGLSTLAIALTRDLVIILIARILSGLSSAVVSTVGYAILFDVVSTEKIGRALGFVSGSVSTGLLVGPALDGVLYQYGGYFITFVPAFVLIATEIALRVLVVVKKRDKPITKDDAQEPSEVSILAKGYTANPLYGTTLPPQTDPSHTDLGNNPNNPTITSSDQICSTTPQSPPGLQTSSSTTKTIHLLLTSPRILTALIALFLLNTILTAYDATIPIHIRTIFSLPATHASLLFLIMVSPLTLSPIAGYIVDRHGPHLPATLGLLILTPPVFLLQFIDSPSFPPPALAAIPPFAALGICLFTIGLGTAFCQPALMAEVSLVIENIEEQQPGCFGPKGVVAFGFGVMNFAFAGGFLVGPVLAGALVEWMGWRGMNIVLGACGCGCVIGVGVVTGGGVWRWRGRGGSE